VKNGFYPLVDITINHTDTYRETDKDVEGKEETETVRFWECGVKKTKETTKPERGKVVLF